MKPTEIGAGLSGPSGEEVVSQLLLGDCVQLLGGLQDNSIDCILIDPPYGINYKSLSHKLPKVTILNDGFEAYALLDKALAAAYPKLKDGCWAFIFTNWKAYPSMAAITERYFPIKNLLIWEKNAWTRGDMKGNWGYQHELVMAARKGETKIRRLLNGKREGNILRYKKLPTNYMKHPCLPAGELVFVDGRWQPIELVRVGAQTNYGTVIETSNHEAEAIVTITLEDGSTTRATENHPFLVAREGNIYWIEARHLILQDEILTLAETARSKTVELRISSLSIPLHTSGITLVQEGYHATQNKASQSASFSLRRVGSVKTTQVKERVYNLTIQGTPAFDTLVGVSHNTEKPVDMLKYLIEKSTNPGDTVLDFFAGSCSTGVAAKQANRNFIGMEIDPVWFKVAQERLDAA